MKKLPDVFKTESFCFKLVERDRDVVIYEVRELSNNQLFGYDVFIIQKQKETELLPMELCWRDLWFTCLTLYGAKRRALLLRRKLKLSKN